MIRNFILLLHGNDLSSPLLTRSPHFSPIAGLAAVVSFEARLRQSTYCRLSPTHSSASTWHALIELFLYVVSRINFFGLNTCENALGNVVGYTLNTVDVLLFVISKT